MQNMIHLFWDVENGGFYFIGNDGEVLISREKEIYDGALPSGNSVAAVSLVRMAFLTGQMDFLDKAEDMLAAFYGDMDRYPSGGTHFLQSLLLRETPAKEVVVLGTDDDQDRTKLLSKLQAEFSPNVFILTSDSPASFSNIAPFAAKYKQIDSKITVYVCENFSCHKPTTDTDEALQTIFKF